MLQGFCCCTRNKVSIDHGLIEFPVVLLPEEAAGPEGEEQSERLKEEKQRVRGPEGQRPLIPKKVCGK